MKCFKQYLSYVQFLDEGSLSVYFIETLRAKLLALFEGRIITIFTIINNLILIININNTI